MANEHIRIPGDHVLNYSFDRDSQSLRTKLADTEISIELDADDGDNVVSKKEQLSSVVVSGVSVNCERMSKAAVYIIGSCPSLLIEVSPDGVDFVTVHNSANANEVVIKDICAKEIKITGADATLKLVLQG